MRRYRAAGATEAGRFTFPSDRDAADDFFSSRLMTAASDIVVIEGDSPLRGADLRVFVAPPPAAGQTLLVRERRDRAAQLRAQADAMRWLLAEPDGAARLLEQLVGDPVVTFARDQPELLEQVRLSLLAGIDRARAAPPPTPTEHWAVAAGYAGIEHAQLVVLMRVRIRSGDGRRGCWRRCGGCASTGCVRRRAGLAWLAGADHCGRGRSGRPAGRRDAEGGGPGEAERPGRARALRPRPPPKPPHVIAPAHHEPCPLRTRARGGGPPFLRSSTVTGEQVGKWPCGAAAREHNWLTSKVLLTAVRLRPIRFVTSRTGQVAPRTGVPAGHSLDGGRDRV